MDQSLCWVPGERFFFSKPSLRGAQRWGRQADRKLGEIKWSLELWGMRGTHGPSRPGVSRGLPVVFTASRPHGTWAEGMGLAGLAGNNPCPIKLFQKCLLLPYAMRIFQQPVKWHRQAISSCMFRLRCLKYYFSLCLPSPRFHRFQIYFRNKILLECDYVYSSIIAYLWCLVWVQATPQLRDFSSPKPYTLYV